MECPTYLEDMAENHDSESKKEGSYIKDDEIVDTIFNECDYDGRGRVLVSDLMQFMTKEAKPALDGYELNKLRLLLDPEDCGCLVTRSAFKRAMKLWAKTVNSDNFFTSSDLGIVDAVQFVHSSPISSKTNGHCTDALDMSNITSYSCGSNDHLNNSISNDPGRLLDHVRELEHTVRRQEEMIQELQNQLHNSEENYTTLQADNNTLRNKIASLKPIAKQHEVLQKECELLKDAAPLMEMEISELKSRIQQLNREARAHKQELKHLENQNVELITKLEIKDIQNKEYKEILAEQKAKLEKLENQCNQHQHQIEQQLKHIAELEQTVSDQLTSIKHLQNEKDSLALRLINTEDELLSAHSQLSQVSSKKVELSFDTDEDDVHEDDSKPHSLVSCSSDQHPSIFLELQALKDSLQLEGSFPDIIGKEIEVVKEVNDKDAEKNELNSSMQVSIKRCGEQQDQEVQCLYSPQQHQEIQTSPKRTEADTKSVTTQTPEFDVVDYEPRRKKKCYKNTDEEPEVHSTSDIVLPGYKFDLNELGASPALSRWIQDVEKQAMRRKTNLQVRPGGRDRDPPLEMTPQLKRASSMEYEKHPHPVSTSTPMAQESVADPVALKQRLDKEEPDCNGGIRRCMSESQVLAREGGSCSSGSSETSSSSALVLGLAEAFPSIPDAVLQQLGLTTHTPTNDVLSDQDVESKCSALALAFKTDKLTLASRHDRQQRQRDQAERNMCTEVSNLKAAVHNLNYLCKDSESIDILGRIQDQVDVLQRSTERVSSSAEMYGAVQQENRLSKAIDVMLLHMENMKRMYEKVLAELEEARRVLQENNIVIDSSVDTPDVGQPPRHKRYNSLVTLVGAAAGKRGRRASIAAFARPQGSTDSTKSSTSYITFGDAKSNARTLPPSRRTSLSPTASSMDNLAPGWDRSDRLLRSDVAAGSMDNIQEITEARKNSLSKLEIRVAQQKSLEENNNSQSDGSVHDRLGYPDPDNDALLGDLGEDDIIVATSPQVTVMETSNSVSSFREYAMDVVSRGHNAVMDYILPLNVDHVLIQTRRCATVLLLVAALLCLVSTFIPTYAQSRDCLQYSSWVSLEEIIRPYARLRHYAPPPT